MVQQPLDRPRSKPACDIGDLLGLFGNVDVDRIAPCQQKDGRQPFRIGRAQRVRGDADARVSRQPLCCRARRVQQPGVLIRRCAKAQLPDGQRLPTRAAMAVKDRQMRQADTRPLGRCENALRQLGGIVIRRAAGLVVQIVKLSDSRKTRLLHLHEGLRRDCLDMICCQPGGKAIHQIAPGPETVLPRRAMFGHPGHCALEAVAVQVRQGGQQGLHTNIAGLRGGVGRHCRNRSFSYHHTHARSPACCEKGLFGKDHDDTPYV